MGKKIRYHSFDFDGSLSNEAYWEKLEATDALPLDAFYFTESPALALLDTAILDANRAFLDGIRDQGTESESYVMVGSNRQSLEMDCSNGRGRAGFSSKKATGSAFPRINAIAKYVGATVDKFLLADIEREKISFGSEYDAIINSKYMKPNGSYKKDLIEQGITEADFSIKIKEDTDFMRVEDDASKVSLLLAQMQKVSMEHPSDEIEFNFYDDRKDILEGEEHDLVKGLKGFFHENPELIPKNITLKLQAYSGPDHVSKRRSPMYYDCKEVQLISTIRGTGSVPKHETDWVGFYKDVRSLPVNEVSIAGVGGRYETYAEKINADRLLSKYIVENRAVESLPKLSQDYLGKYLRRLPHEEIQKLNPTVQQFREKVVATEVGHAKAIGRFHAFKVMADPNGVIKDELKKLKGDHLKREILADFKNEIEQVASLDELRVKQRELMHPNLEKYKILATGQGLMTKVMGLETSLLKALKQMFAEKELELLANHTKPQR